MGLLILAIGAVLVAIPGMFSRWGRRVQPATWARLSGACLVGGFATIEVAALLYAVPSLVARVSGGAVESICYRMIEQFAPGGLPAAVFFGAVASMLPVWALRTLRHVRRTRHQVFVAADIGCHTSHMGYDVVTLDTPNPIAFSVRAPAPQIVLSTATTSCLSDEQLNLVLNHEAAHLDHHHQAYLSAAGVVDACLGIVPFTRRSTAELRLALERWADEAATGAPPARRVLRVALRSVAATMLDPAIAGLSPIDNLAERMVALGQPPVSPTGKDRWVAYVPAAAAALELVVIIGLWHQQLLMILSLIGHCPD